MSSDSTPPKFNPQNPLAIIALLVGLVEAAFAYPVTKLSGVNQTIMVVFMVGFPVLLMLCLLLVMWFKPGVLYGPKDYAKDESFLQAIGRAIPAQGITPQPIQQQATPANTGPAQAAPQLNP